MLRDTVAIYVQDHSSIFHTPCDLVELFFTYLCSAHLALDVLAMIKLYPRFGHLEDMLSYLLSIYSKVIISDTVFLAIELVIISTPDSDDCFLCIYHHLTSKMLLINHVFIYVVSIHQLSK